MWIRQVNYTLQRLQLQHVIVANDVTLTLKTVWTDLPELSWANLLLLYHRK